MCTDPLIIEEFAEKRLGDEPCGKFTKYWRGQLEADADFRELDRLPYDPAVLGCSPEKSIRCLTTGRPSAILYELSVIMASIGVEGGSTLYAEYLKYAEEQNKLKGAGMSMNLRNDIKKVFISQPMKDKTEAEIKAVREAIKGKLDAKFGAGNWTEILSYRPEWAEELQEGANKRVFFLGKSLELLSEADYAFFADYWYDYDGCAVEHEVCKRYGIPNNTEE